MRTFIVTFKSTKGHIELSYNVDGFLVRFINEAEFSREQFLWFAKRFPIHFGDLAPIANSLGFIVTEQIREITFDDFYEAYGYKVGKVSAQNAWKKLSKDDQFKAYDYIGRYNTFLRTNQWINKAYHASYLNQKRWLD